MHSAWLASGNIRSPVRSEGTTKDTTLAGEGDSLLCALQPTPAASGHASPRRRACARRSALAPFEQGSP